jgi:RNA polymerase sigma-70 factor (ECF subfamily)
MAAMGASSADLEDLAQEVFLVVERKLDDFDGRNLQGWIYGIARKVVASHRRRAWVRNLFLRRVEEASTQYDLATPVALLERKQAWQIVDSVLAKMSDKRRRVFALFEIEGYSGEEIAALEGVPIKTIWTRLHHARKDFVTLASACEQKEQG